MEHYVTLFDHKFLPQGLALYASLVRHHSPCRLWVVCMDQKAEHQLRLLGLPDLQLIPLEALENEALRRVKAEREWCEYCWTLTPFACMHVLAKQPEAGRVTYVDADVFLFRSPACLFEEFEQSGKMVLLTEHAFDSRYEHLARATGRFCVQFLTFCNNPDALRILQDWSANCLAECTSQSRGKPAGWGDQKYLDEWPTRFGEIVHVLEQKDQVLAPWNADIYMQRAGSRYFPILYHFHSFRILGPRYARLHQGYRVRRARHIYRTYLLALEEQVGLLARHGIPLAFIPLSREKHWVLRTVKRWLFNNLVIRRHHLMVQPLGRR